MEGEQLQPVYECLQNFPKLPLWIIEYVWAHKLTDIQEVLDPCTWPEVDSQPLSLEDSWRLRVASAQVYSIMKNKDMEHFERVMAFLETTHRLLPRLVVPIKHMKIMFGLKTMVIMWMLREGRGMVDTVFKINQFFPSKLPQYQDQCNQREMFLMRKNHLDFKALAHNLAVDKDKLEDYIKNQMEEQYGEHYAQKVEDRLLHYLHELESVLPGDTYADKILKKESPVTEEEKLLLEVITSDSTTIATTLKKLLNCDVASCRLGGVSQSLEHGKNRMESAQPSRYVLQGNSSKALLKSDFQPEVLWGGEEADQEVSKDSPLFLENDNDPDVRRHQQTEEDGEVVNWVMKEDSDKEKEDVSQSVQEATSSPQFCSKHHRWVKSILQQCPDDCSEEFLQVNVSSSPLLFLSSSSTSTSQDLTPSDLIPCPPDEQRPPQSTSTHPQTAAQACEQANPEDQLSSGSSGSATDTSQIEPPPQPSLSRNTLQPTLLSPVVRLIDIASVRGIYPTFKLHQASPDNFTMSSHKQAATTSRPQELTSPHLYTSGNNTEPQGIIKDSMFDRTEAVVTTDLPNTTHKVQTAPVPQDASTSTSCEPPARQFISKLSRKFRRACAAARNSQVLDGSSQTPLTKQLKMASTTIRTSSLPLSDDFSVSGPPTHSNYTSDSGTLTAVFTANQIPFSTESSRQVVHQSSIKPHPQTPGISLPQSMTLPCSTVVPSTSNSNCVAVRSEISRVQRDQLRLSLHSQAMLLQSNLLKPYVSLTRLSPHECYRMTKGKCSISYVEPVLQGSNNVSDEDRIKKDGEDADSSFDLNLLYSSHSSSSDSEDSLNRDPDYKPCIKRKRYGWMLDF